MVVGAAPTTSAPGYRLATAGPASVTATLDATGTIESVNEATLSFPTTGQVSAVNVAVGQQATAGQTLATLDTTSLRARSPAHSPLHLPPMRKAPGIPSVVGRPHRAE